MINSKTIVQLAKKWQKTTAMKRSGISFPRSSAAEKSSIVNKGSFVVYTTDNIRSPILQEYLSRNTFIKLLRMSEEKFELQYDRRTLLNYIMSLVKGFMPEELVKALVFIPEELEKALLTSLSTCHFSASSALVLGQSHQQTPIFGY